MSSAPAAMRILLIFASLLSVDGNAFLGRVEVPAFSDPVLGQALLAEIEGVLGSEHRGFTEKRLRSIEKDLQRLVVAMPKIPNGGLQRAAVGYILHRAFVERHGWLVRNLAPEGNALAMWNESAPTSILTDRVPKGVIEAFEKRAGGSSIGLHEVAVMAATLEHLVHKEALERLELAYAAHKFTSDDVLSVEEAESVLEAYMSIYILGGYLSALGNSSISPEKVLHVRNHVHEMYPNWPETRQFMLDVKHRIAPNRDYFYFADVASIIEEIGEHFGEFQDRECTSLKAQLTQMELPGAAGRVRLADFYKPAVDQGDWAFTESIGYLRQLGALDESDPANPRVIISNYVSSPSNCVASSSYYSVCCRDECEGLLSHLEHELQAPDAPASRLASLVAALPSRTEEASRTLSPWLLARLDEVATHHGGQVPIHGRLFAQWMHYAYPRECPYPHVSGAISPERLEDMLSSQDEISSIMASLPDMQEHVETFANVTDVDSDASMWTLDEELLVTRPELAMRRAPSNLRGVALIGVASSILIGFLRSAGSSSVGGAAQKYMV